MNRKELIKEIIDKGLSKDGKRITFTNESIREKLRNIYDVLPETKDKPFHEYEKLSDGSIEGTFYFERLSNQSFRPIPHAKAKTLKSDSLNISTIINAYDKEDIETKAIKVKIMAFLFEYPLNEKEIQVIDNLRENTDMRITLKNYVSNINIGNSREDVIAQITNILAYETHPVITICINDLNIIINLSSMIVLYLGKGGKLFLLYDPPSMFDLISYKLVFLQRFGVNIYILPFKNKYPVYGIFPNWSILDSKIEISKALIFTTSMFHRIRDGRAIAKYITQREEINDCIKRIKNHHSEIHYSLSAIPLKDEYTLNMYTVSEEEYITYIKGRFNTSSEHTIYKNTSMCFETLEIESIYRRKDSFTNYRLSQQWSFMEFLDSKGFIEIDKESSTLIFKPIFIKLSEDIISLINPPFIEYNTRSNRFEIEEGHIRIWLCYHVYEVKRVKVLVVRDIHDKYFELINKEVIEETKISKNYSWDETIKQINSNSIHNEDHYVLPRLVEKITHELPRKQKSKIMNELFDELLNSETILHNKDRGFHNYLK